MILKVTQSFRKIPWWNQKHVSKLWIHVVVEIGLVFFYKNKIYIVSNASSVIFIIKIDFGGCIKCIYGVYPTSYGSLV